MSTTTGGLVILSEMLDKLPLSERKIATFILEDPNTAITLTASELGERSSTSGAAVIRLCKSLGLKGIQELKLKVAGDLHKKDEEVYRDIKPNESQETVIEKMTNNSIQTLRKTVEILDRNELSKAVEAVKKAKTIHFFGVGASSIIALDAQQKFMRINKQATAFTDIHIVAMLIANIEPGDVVFGISFSGETNEVAKILDLANKKGAKTISLTKFGSSPVSDRAQIKLYTSASKEATFRSGATSSRLAQLHIIDILFMSVATQNYDEIIHHLDQTRETIEMLGNKLGKRNEVRGEQE
ncbi:MurR/RpiR family transcriptional regulator [Cytobacillus suaedae]|nr:MurR/RpiR family transcriptional regulator [Cytobacillus suaedae]